MINNIVGGAKSKLAPLISFNTLVDTNIGLVNLIRRDYLDPSVFKIEFFDQSFYKILSDLYYRKTKNPLKVFAKENVEDEILDQYYEEFMEKCYKDILGMSIGTEMINLVDIFNDSQEVVSTILCYKQEEIDLLNTEPKLEKNEKVLLSKISQHDIDKTFQQFYLYSLDEIKPFENCRLKTFYFSGSGINFDEETSDLIITEPLKKIITQTNAISVFDMYKKDIIMKGT